jgi:uncharacterized protein YlxP (DUF503 family)
MLGYWVLRFFLKTPEDLKTRLPKEAAAVMVVGVGLITFRLHECHSLKEKRRIVKAVIAQLRNHFNASVAEVADNDVHQRAVVGFSLVGNDKALINSKIDKMFNLADELGLAEVIDSEMELITV